MWGECMLDRSVIDKLLYKADIDDIGDGVITVSDTGDHVKYYNSDLKYLDVRRKILGNSVLAKKVYDSNNTGIYMNWEFYQGSSKVFYTVFVGVGDLGIGTSIEAYTKRIRYFSDAGEKEFISFESMRKYLDRKV